MKNVFLTGASAGIGRAVAERLAENGYRTWGTSRDVSRLPGLRNFTPVELDLDRPDSIREGVSRALDESLGFDVLVNCGGNGVFAPLALLDDDTLREQFETLVFAPLAIARSLLPGMRSRGGGIIINVTSLAAQFPIPYMGAYSAAKAALSSLSWSLEMELMQQGIRVVDLRPGDIHTDFHRAMKRHPSLEQAGADDDIARAFRAYSARMERAPSPALVARSVLDILDRDASPPSRLAVGTVVQSRIFPFLAKISPLPLTRFVLRRYYGLKARRR